jgi:lipopolysaccharide/colanic/teichoic acid biosynthesis glycosyltransferase
VTALPAAPLPEGTPAPADARTPKRRRGGSLRGFWRQEPVFTFAYRVFLGLIAFLFAVVVVSLVYFVSGLSIGYWIVAVQIGVVAAILLFGENLREAAYDIAAQRVPPVVIDIQTGLKVIERAEASVAYSRVAPHSIGERILKRAVDIALAAFALVLVLPMLLITAIAIKLDSPGPVLVSSRRIGRSGKEFRLLKFRTRVTVIGNFSRHGSGQREDSSIEEFNEPGNDKPQLTRLGSFLRRTRIDELPQLLNVLRGDMSLVGPAPVFREELALYGDALASVLSIRPGVTGPWRMANEGPAQFHWAPFESDLTTDWSIVADVRILLQTLWFADVRDPVTESKYTR